MQEPPRESFMPFYSDSATKGAQRFGSIFEREFETYGNDRIDVKISLSKVYIEFETKSQTRVLKVLLASRSLALR
jgi:hypothetical protein